MKFFSVLIHYFKLTNLLGIWLWYNSMYKCMWKLSTCYCVNLNDLWIVQYYEYSLNCILAYYAWPRTPSTKVTRKERNPWSQHVHRATRPRSYAIDKVWEAVTSRCLGNGRSDASCKQYGGVQSIICYLCFVQHAWSCYFFFFKLSTLSLTDSWYNFIHVCRN